MKKEITKKVISDLRAANPYPVDVFTEPTNEEWRDVGKFLEENGRSSGRIFGKWGRMVWENCIATMEEYFDHHRG